MTTSAPDNANPQTGMIAITVAFVVAPGQGPALEAALGDLARLTQENEPGVLIYRLCRAQDNPTRYRLIELYENKSALDQHLATPWFHATRPLIGPLLAETPVMEQYDVLG